MHYERDQHSLEVYLETRKRRLFVGQLHFDPKSKCYTFTYDMKYLYAKAAFALGPELPIIKPKFISEPGKIFPTFEDRIPSKQNPAYAEYCRSQGILPEEDNQIILLTTIGHRGPSSFIFEAIFKPVGSVAEELKQFRQELALSRWDIAMLFEIPELTILKIENGKSADPNILRLIHYYLTVPEITLKQLEMTGKKVHRDTRTRVFRYFKGIA